jgi:hypothetical protein
MDQAIAGGDATDEFVPFYPAGAEAKGEFRCSDCGYGVTVTTALPPCPMCSSGSWERKEWSPLTRALAAARTPL